MSFLSQFHYRITGSDSLPKLVLLHGLMGFSSNWQRVIKAFESNFQILVYDQRGHGRSFKPETGYRPEDYAQDLLRICEELGWTTIHLVGHSMGGRNALCFASLHPTRVEKLIIEDISPDFALEAIQNIRQIVNAVPVPFRDRDAAKHFFENDLASALKGSADALALGPFLQANLMTLENGQLSWRFSKKAILESLESGRAQSRWPEWRALTMPTLLVRGQNSKDLSRVTFDQMLSENPRVEGIEIPDSGHWVHFDQPELFIQALQRFLIG